MVDHLKYIHSKTPIGIFHFQEKPTGLAVCSECMDLFTSWRTMEGSCTRGICLFCDKQHRLYSVRLGYIIDAFQNLKDLKNGHKKGQP